MKKTSKSDLEFRIYIHVDVNGKGGDFTLDTGSEVTIITEPTSRDLKLELSSPSVDLVGADVNSLNVLGECEIELMNKGLSIDALSFILKGANRNLLGIVEIRKLHLLAVVNSLVKCEFKFNPFELFKELFQGLGTMPEVFRINQKDDTRPYKIWAPRSIPLGLRSIVKVELNNRLKLGVIKPVEIPTDWCFVLTIVPKANGGIRTLRKQGVYPYVISKRIIGISTSVLIPKDDDKSCSLIPKRASA